MHQDHSLRGDPRLLEQGQVRGMGKPQGMVSTGCHLL